MRREITLLLLVVSLFLLTNCAPKPNPNVDKLAKWTETIYLPLTFGRNQPISTFRNYATTLDIEVYGVGRCAGTQTNDAFYICNVPEQPWQDMLLINDAPVFYEDHDNYPPYSNEENPDDLSIVRHLYRFSYSASEKFTFSIGDVFTADNDGYYIIHISENNHLFTPIHNSQILQHKFSIPIVQQGLNQCGPACLAMYCQYLNIRDDKNKLPSFGTNKDSIIDSLNNFKIPGNEAVRDRFWPAGKNDPKVSGPKTEPYIDGYLDNDQEHCVGTYSKYLVDIAAKILDESDIRFLYFLRAFQYMNMAELEYFLSNNTPVLVCIWASADQKNQKIKIGPGNKKFTHFVLVNGFDKTRQLKTEDFLYITDPLYANEIEVSYSDFQFAWNGEKDHPDNLDNWGVVIIPYN